MDCNLFKVIFTGKLLPDFEAETVIVAFAEKFKMTSAKAEKVIRAERELVLKPKAEHVKAYKLKSALEGLGMEVRLERVALVTAKPKPKPKQTASPKQEVVDSNKQTTAQKPEALGHQAGAWSLEPVAIQKEQEAATEHEPEPVFEPHRSTQQTTAQRSQSAHPSGTQVHSGRTVGELVKTIGGWAVGIFAVFFIAVKKFGLFKLLKIGGLMTATAFAGYDSAQICMGNDMCEEAIEDQLDDCWEQSGLDGYDWENMSEAQYDSLKPQLENDFVGCFVYEDTGSRVLTSPIDLRLDLIDNCYLIDNDQCLQLAESQFNSCYQAHDIQFLVSAETLDFYQVVMDNQKDFKNYYSCFTDQNGSPMFADVINEWSYIYEGE